MAFSTTALNEITQTGTDADFSGLVGLTGITTIDRVYYTEYDLGPNRLILQGTSTLSGSVREQLSFDDTATFNRIEIASGATFTIGTLEANPLDYDYMLNVPSISEEIGTLGFSEKNGFNAIGFDGNTRSTIYINGGTFNVYGRIINIGAYGSTSASVLDFQYAKFSRPGANFSYNSNFTLLNSAVTTAFVASSYSSFTGFQPVIGSTFYVGLSNTTPNNSVYDLKDIPDLNGTRIVETGKGGVNDGNSPLIRYTNLLKGSDQVFHVSAGRYWRTELYSEIKIRALDTVRNPLPNARAWYAGASGVNEVNDVDGSGDYDFTFLFASRKASSGVIDPYIFYTKNEDTVSDLIDVGCVELTKNISKLPDISLRGLGVKTIEVLLPDDILMTELSEATISAYTEINDAFKAYDSLKLLFVNNYVNEDETIIGRSGSQLVSKDNRNLILDSSAASVSAYTATETTLKATTFTGGFDDNGGTGIAIIQGATALDGGVFDSDISYDSSTLTLTDVTCSKEIVFENAGTYTIVGGEFTDVDAPVPVTLNIDVNTTISGTIGANVTVNSPTGQIDFSGVVAGSQIVVCQTGTQTESYRINSSGVSETTGAIASGTYDYTVMKAGYFPVRVTGVVVGTSPVPAQISQVEDRAYTASSGLTFGTTATYNTTTKEFAVTVATEVQNWYSFWIEAWINESSLVNTAFPISTFGSSSFSLNNGAEFTSGSIQYLSRDGFRYVDSGGTVTAQYCAILSQGVTPGLQAEYQQASGAAPTDAQNTGNVDQVVQYYGDVTHGNFDYTNYLKFKVQANGYREARADVVATYGSLEPTLYVIALTTLPIDGLTLGDPAATGITITKEATPVSYDAGNGAKNYSITILDSGTNSAETILREINYNLAQDASYQSLEPFDWPEMVIKNGSNYETAMGIIESDGTPALHGVFVTRDGTNPHPDFARFQADDGTYGSPLPTLNSSGFTAGSRVLIYNQTTDTDLYNDKVVGSSHAYTYTEGNQITPGDIIEIYTCFTNATNSYDGTAVAVATAGGFSILVNEREYTDYAAKGIDGSLETEYVLDGTNMQLDIQAVDNNWDIRNLSAWYRYQMFDSAIAIKSFFNALNTNNGVVYEFDTDKGNLLIDNLRADLALELSGYTLKRKDGLIPYLNPTTGGGHPEFKYRNDALAVETGVSGLTPTESSRLFSTALESTLTEIKGAGWTTETLKDIRDNAGGGLDEAGLHNGLDSYANKDAYKADVSEIDTLKSNQNIINTNVKNGSVYPVISGPGTA